MDFFDPKIPKKKVVVEILHTHSSQYLLKCMLFLNPSSKYSNANAETIEEFLYNSGQFIPIQQAAMGNSPTTSLYNVNKIIYIKESGTCPPEELEGQPNVLVTLNNKMTFKLLISKNMMGQNNRLAEYANSPPLFLKFIKNKSYIYLNKKFIFSMRNI